ncbi:MAG TPA: glycosyltransferase family 39 protein [Candidatus Nanoarchaeia archaeon]|nr:glycosyltransferase family 39 protein [Candidatus Nanoarchaeia archaeon]
MNSVEEKNQKKSYWNNTTKLLSDLIFSKDKKIERYLVLTIFVGFILRIIASINLDVFADDMVHVSQSAGILTAKLLSTHSNPALFYYLTDISFNIFGYTTFASRFFPLITGTLLIPLAFLIGTLIFKNKKIGLFAALMTALSPFLIRNTFGEASLVVLFFCFFGVYLGLLYLNTKKYLYLILSGILFGLGFLTKYNAPFFILSFLIFSLVFLYIKKEKIITKKNITALIIFLAIIFVFVIPPIAFNYLIYKDKGITDVYFSRLIQTERTQEIYGGLAGQENSFIDNLFNLRNYNNSYLLFFDDLIVLVFGVIGLLFLAVRKKYLELSFFLIFLLVPFILQSAGAPLAKHFVFMSFLLAISSGLFVNEIYKKINNKKIFYLIIILVFLAMLANLTVNNGTPRYYYHTSPTSELKSYLHDNVKQSDLVVFDARIYTSRMFWLATPNHFIDSYRFTYFNEVNNNISIEHKVPLDVYFVECAVDDCGWGTIKDQPDVNTTSEAFFSFISVNVPIHKIVDSKYYNNNELFEDSEEIPFYKIYKQTLYFNPLLIEQTNQINTFYFAPYLYNDMSNYLYNYHINSLLDRLLEKLAYFIIIISIILTIISFILVLIFLTLYNIHKLE